MNKLAHNRNELVRKSYGLWPQTGSDFDIQIGHDLAVEAAVTILQKPNTIESHYEVCYRGGHEHPFCEF